MRTRYGVSPWVLQFPDVRRPDFPRARGVATADVVIVGGGLTGCATAHACAAAGLKTIVLEAGRIGQGSSGRGAGLLLPEPGPAFRDIVSAHGLRAARHAFQSWRKASLDAAALLKRLSIPCGLLAQDTLAAAWRDDGRLLRREHDAREAAGLDVAWLSRAQAQKLAPLDASAGLKVRDGFALDPYRACVGLTRAAAKRRARIFERSAVRTITFSRKDVEVATGECTVRARTIVIATGSATHEFRTLRRHFKRREEYFVLTEPVPATVRKAMGMRGVTVSDTRIPTSRLRWTADDRILIAGADQDETAERTRGAVLVQRTGQLMYQLLMMYPAISGLKPEYGWEMSYGQTADGLMYIGSHRNFPNHLFALGGSGDSVTGAFLAARILVRAIQGSSEKADDVFSWAR